MVASALQRPPLIHALWIGLFLAAFAQTFAWLWERWTASIYVNAHGLLVPVVVAWLAWENLSRNPVREPRSSALGFLLLVPGLAMLALDSVIRSDLLAATGLVVALPGLSLLVLGVERTRSLAFPLALLPLMVPLPYAWLAPLHYGLRVVTAQGAKVLLELSGRPTLIEGTVLRVPRAEVEVADACSGYSALFAALVLVVVLCYLGRSWPRRALLLIAAPVVALFGNVLRAVWLVIAIERWGTGVLETAVHQGSGIVAFAGTLIVLFLLAERRAVFGR
jgi:exosortase